MTSYLTQEQINQFHRDGVLVVRQFYDMAAIHDIQKGIYDVIGQVMARHSIPDKRQPFCPASFDEGYIDLITQDRCLGSEIYDAVKYIPAFTRLVSHPAHEAMFRELRGNSMPGLAGGSYGIRIDNPYEDKYRAMWHQEYPAQLRSTDGLVFWSPLVKITRDIGPVVLCPGSHKEGPLPVFDADPENAGRTGAYALKIYKEHEILENYTKVSPLTEPGDLVIIDFLVLHASGFNHSDRPRWTMQFRYFNFNEPIGRSHGWKGSYAAGVDFRAIHPELYIEPERE